MWALRGTLPDKFLLVLFWFFDIVTKLTTDRVFPDDYAPLELEITEFLCLLELNFPSTELTIVFHLMLHLVLLMQLWGPLKRLWMFPIERMLGFLIRKVKNRAHPEASVTAAYQLFRGAQQQRREIERSLASSPHFARYSKHLDASHKLSASGAAISAAKLSGAIQLCGVPKSVKLSDQDCAGLVSLFRAHSDSYHELMLGWEADVAAAEAKGAASVVPLLATWNPAGRVLTEQERSMLLGPEITATRYARAEMGGVTFRAANKVVTSASSRYADLFAMHRAHDVPFAGGPTSRLNLASSRPSTSPLRSTASC